MTAPARAAAIESEFRKAFDDVIQTEELEVVRFEDISADRLGAIIADHPSLLKPLIAVCNIAGRAIQRNLGIRNVDTYRPNLSEAQVMAIAGYIKSFLPGILSLSAIVEVDRIQFVDKEIRRLEGHWEDLVLDALNSLSTKSFAKRKFVAVGEEEFEIDAASPIDGDIVYAVDVKRIEARRDIHKRTDEIVNKASRFKEAHPTHSFGAVIYYPFVDEHINIERRMSSDSVDGLVSLLVNRSNRLRARFECLWSK